jgi:hypothetical protein
MVFYIFLCFLSPFSLPVKHYSYKISGFRTSVLIKIFLQRLAVEILVSGFVFDEEDFLRPWEGQNDNLERYIYAYHLPIPYKTCAWFITEKV